MVRRTKSTESIEAPFGIWTGVSLKPHVLDGGPDLPTGNDKFEGYDTIRYEMLFYRTLESRHESA